MKNHISTVRLTAWLLCLLSAGSALLSCQNRQDRNSETDLSAASVTEETAPETKELTELEKRQNISDNLPEKDYGGKEFRVILEGARTEEFYTEEQTGDSCNDALFMRNSKIESRFNCALSVLPQTDLTSTVNFFKNMVLGGANDAELCGYCDYMAYSPVGAGVCQNWLDIPRVDVTQPWHNHLANDGATINGKLFSICSDLSVSSMTYTYGMFFNTRLASNYDMTSDALYQLVRDGKWTIDKFIALTKDIYADANPNGKEDQEDLYGFGYYICNPADVWLTAFNQPLTEVNAEGRLDITFMCEKTENALTLIRDYQNNSTGFYTFPTQYDEEIYFANGTLVFAPLRFAAAFKALRDMKDIYAILPYPKWDEAQEHYYTNADDKFLVFSVPVTVQDTEFVGTIYEALSAESYRNVYPAYYDVALKGKYSSDPNTADMIDLIMSGRKFEVSFQFGEKHFARLPYLFRDLLLSKTALTKKYATVEKQLEKNLTKFYELFEDKA